VEIIVRNAFQSSFSSSGSNSPVYSLLSISFFFSFRRSSYLAVPSVPVSPNRGLPHLGHEGTFIARFVPSGIGTRHTFSEHAPLQNAPSFASLLAMKYHSGHDGFVCLSRKARSVLI